MGGNRWRSRLFTLTSTKTIFLLAGVSIDGIPHEASCHGKFLLPKSTEVEKLLSSHTAKQ